MPFFARWRLFILLLFLIPYISVNATEQANAADHYRITRDDGSSFLKNSSEIYDIFRDTEFKGYVRKEASVFNIFYGPRWVNYYSYDNSKDYNGAGYFSLECDHISDCYEDLRIYNEKGKYEGYICLYDPWEILIGNFYNESNKLIAFAQLEFYQDQNRIECLLYSKQFGHVIACLNFDNYNDVNVVIYHPEEISTNMLKIFAVFICDKELLESSMFFKTLTGKNKWLHQK